MQPNENPSEAPQAPRAGGAQPAPPAANAAPSEPPGAPESPWLLRLRAEVADVGTLTRGGGRYTLTLHADGREVRTRSAKVVRKEAAAARPKSKGGRPWLSPGERTKTFSIKVPASLLDALKREASENGVKVSVLARKKLSRGIK